jgi:hypothetical protein
VLGYGAVAQLGERLVCNQEATGSIPVSSTKIAVGEYAKAHLGSPETHGLVRVQSAAIASKM